MWNREVGHLTGFVFTMTDKFFKFGLKTRQFLAMRIVAAAVACLFIMIPLL
jgi:hypothetical protein